MLAVTDWRIILRPETFVPNGARLPMTASLHNISLRRQP